VLNLPKSCLGQNAVPFLAYTDSLSIVPDQVVRIRGYLMQEYVSCIFGEFFYAYSVMATRFSDAEVVRYHNKLFF
jgi:hypothetical protein